MLAPVVHSHLSKTLRGGARDGLCDCENNSNIFTQLHPSVKKLHYNSFVTSTTAKEHQRLWGVFYNLPQLMLIVQLIIPLG